MGDSFAQLFSLVANNLQLHRRRMVNRRKRCHPTEIHSELPETASHPLGCRSEI